MTVWVERYNRSAISRFVMPFTTQTTISFSRLLQLVLQLVCAVVYRYLVVVGAKQERVAHIIQKSEAFHIRAATFVFQVLEVEVSRNGRIHNQNVRLINA